tara:strand:- start:308 stop:478 length:171 start_codon:yes stop_codon:yes gene_type:complete
MKIRLSASAWIDLLALAMIGAGLWIRSPSIALIVIGSILYGTHLIAAMRTGKAKND